MKHPLSFGPVLLAAGVLASVSGQAATQIGVTSAVVPAARGTPTGAEPRVLQVGLDMQANERVQTDADGKAHLLFLDGSALSIGPNSEVVLDEYVYDPVARTGKIALSTSRGVFRLVGGAISKTTPVELRTPSATIGVRGGIATASVGATTSAAFLFGSEMTVAGAGGSTQTASRPGFEITTNPNGTVNPPLPLSERTLAGFSAMEGGSGQAGPGGPSVSDDDVANTQVSTLNSSVAASDDAPAAGGGSGGAGAPPPLDEATDASQQQMTLEASTSAGGDEGSPSGSDDGPTAPIFIPGGGGPTSPTGLTLSDVFVGRIKRATNMAVGTNDALAGDNLTLLGQPGIVNGVFDAQATSTTRFTINVPPSSAPLSTATADPFGLPGLSGDGILFPDQQFLLYELAHSSSGNRVLAFAGVPTAPANVPTSGVSAYTLRPDFPRGSTLPFIEDPGPGAAGLTTPGYIAWAPAAGDRAFGAGIVFIDGQGPAQVSALSVLTGDVPNDGAGRPHVQGFAVGQRRLAATGQSEYYASSLSSADAADGSDFFGPTANHFVLESSAVNANDTVLTRGGFKSVNGVQSSYFANTPAVQGAPLAATTRSTRVLNGFAAALELEIDSAGNVTGAHDLSNFNPADVTISTNATNNIVASTFMLDDNGHEFSVDVTFGGSGADAFIDDGRFFARSTSVMVSGFAAAGDLAMTTSSALQHNGLLPGGVSFCNCQYLVWGFFAGDREESAGGPERAQAELGTWVAGAPVNAAQLVNITAQTATYTGHAIAGVMNGSSVYTAVGSMALTFTFGGPLYSLDSVTIGNFDGFSLAGTNTAGPQFNGVTYTNSTFSISGAKPGVGTVNATVTGTFFGPGTPPEETGGKVTMISTAYRAGGTYAAKRP